MTTQTLSLLIYVQNNLRLVGPFMKSYWALKILKCTWWIVIVAEHESGLAWESDSVWWLEWQKFLMEACCKHLMMLINGVSNKWQTCIDAGRSFHSWCIFLWVCYDCVWYKCVVELSVAWPRLTGGGHRKHVTSGGGGDHLATTATAAGMGSPLRG